MLANFMKLVLTQNRLTDGHYAEPYAGGAGIAWPLLFEEFVSHVHINDVNLAVYSFWKTVVSQPEELCRLIMDTRVSMREWKRQKAVLADPKGHSSLELAFSVFFLNRTNRSGILKGGVIGGQAQKGKWKLDARYNKVDLTARILRISRYAARVSVYNLDAADFISTIAPEFPAKSLVYLDPPYYVKGEGLYEDHYGHSDHVEISRLVANSLTVPWIVSYDNVPKVSGMYKGYRRVRYGLSYSAQNRYSGSEVMFFSNDIVIPRVPDPTRVKVLIAGGTLR